MTKYQVIINFSGRAVYEVEAKSGVEAQEIAVANMTIADCEDYDWDIERTEEL